MIRYERSKSSIFLLEILINILLFCVLCVCSLQFFIKSYQLTENTTKLHHAVTACNNVASVFQAGNGTLDSITEYFPQSVSGNGHLYIYLNESYQECDAREVAYYLIVEQKVTSIPSIHVSFYKNGEEACYSIDVWHYVPLTPSTVTATGYTFDTESEVADYE